MSEAAAETNGAVDVIETRTPEGHGFSFKVRATGRLYRVEPTRDPNQPRYWCFRVVRCLPGGRGDPSERPWLGGEAMTLAELPAAVAAIRADVHGWLTQQAHVDLRRWVLDPPAAAVEPSLAGAPPRPSRAATATVASPEAAPD